jgi:hypothetical protein
MYLVSSYINIYSLSKKIINVDGLRATFRYDQSDYKTRSIIRSLFLKACTQSCSLNPESTFLVIQFLRRPTTMYLTTFPRGEVRIICFDMKLF